MITIPVKTKAKWVRVVQVITQISIIICLPSCTSIENNMLEKTKNALLHTEEIAAIIVEHKKNIDNTIENFKNIFLAYEEEELTKNINKLYAQDAFLNDRIKIIHGANNIKNYFSSTFNLIDKASFIVQDIAQGEKDVYLRWLMKIKPKRKKKIQEFLGVSQLRFNKDGLIILHIDHWDFSEILEKFPIVSSIISYARSKAAK